CSLGPCATTEYTECLAVPGAILDVHVVHADPGWIADHDIESARFGDVGKVHRICEGGRRPALDCDALSPERTHDGAQLEQSGTLPGIRWRTSVEQIARSYGTDDLLPLESRRGDADVDCIDSMQSLDNVELPSEGQLSRPVGARVPVSQHGRSPRRDRGQRPAPECITAERIADPDLTIQVGEWGHAHRVVLITVDHGGQPQ